MTQSTIMTFEPKKYSGKLVGVALAALLLNSNAALADEDGEKVYKDVCKSCHGGGMKGWLSGAPKTGKDSAWKDHFSASLEQVKANIFNGNDKHESMGEKEGLSESAVGSAVDHIISSTPSLSEKAKQ